MGLDCRSQVRSLMLVEESLLKFSRLSRVPLRMTRIQSLEAVVSGGVVACVCCLVMGRRLMLIRVVV